MKHRNKFHRWLLIKYQTDSLTLAAQKFSGECQPRVSHSTIMKWAEGAKPRDFTKDTLRSQFPDCPLFIPKPPVTVVTPPTEIQAQSQQQ